MGANGAAGGSGTGPQELGYTTRDKRTDKQKQKDANVELGLGSDRMSNYSVNEGGTKDTGSGNDGVNNSNVVVQAPKVISPTTAEVSQVASVPEVTSEEARASANELILKKRRGRGRSLMVATSSQGVTDKKLTLSEKSLLG